MDVPASVAQCKESEGRLEWSGRCRIEQHIDLELKPFSHRVGHTLAAEWSPDEEVGRIDSDPRLRKRGAADSYSISMFVFRRKVADQQLFRHARRHPNSHLRSSCNESLDDGRLLPFGSEAR